MSSDIPKFGNFASLNLDAWDCEMLTAGFKAVQSVEGGWEFLKTYEPPDDKGFMFSDSIGKRKEIDDAISNRYGGHSGASYGWTMRVLEKIAKDGWETYAKDVLGKNPVKKESKEEKRARFLALPKDMSLEQQTKAWEEFMDVPMTYAEMRERFG